ncbi:efflux RND transporter periplasmic adaptor subunit (plasmid) [Pseudoalteromonas sp. T1lg65]|uniref:efflux RND transporter periplasmic adaptor subunit n=1 Tax=Pseudoalteromonas sp. T1lg65 TaxID=2077101 RepID=UPI003F7A68EE
MQSKWVKGIFPLAIIAVSILAFAGINASASDEEEKVPVDYRPTVSVEVMSAKDHQVMITAHGEVTPLESIKLAAQVSGEVTYWHPHFVEGGIVAEGEVLFNIEKDNFEANLLEAEAELASAKSNLIEERAKAAVAEQEAKSADPSKITDLYLRKPQLLSAKARVKSAEAKIKRAMRDLDNCVVRAPYNALVVSRKVGQGQFVSQGQEVAVLHNIEVAEIKVPIAGFDSTFLPNEIQGLPAVVKTKELNSVTRQGKVDRELGIIDSETRMRHLVIRVTNPYGLSSEAPPIQFGHYVEVNFAGKSLKNIYRLPQELVQNRTVWIVNDDGLLEPKKVNVLRSEGEYFLVSEGLSDDDRLVKTLPEYPSKGMAVKVAKTDTDSQL